MKQLNIILLGLLLCGVQAAHADTVIEEVSDTLPGKAFGGLAGFMVGAAVGGPVGAIGLGVAGVLLSGNIQEATGLHGRAYRIKANDGTTRVVRAPRQQWSIGDRVQVSGSRLAYLEKQRDSQPEIVE